MKSSALVFWLILALLGSAAYGSWIAWRSFHEESRTVSHRPHVAYPPAPPVGPPIKDFKLIERSGKEFDSNELKGHVWIPSFFFASCPGSCWQMNQALSAIQNEFLDDNLRLVSISCDPDNDTPEALRAYAERVHAGPRWFFLTGDMSYIQRIGRDVFLQDVQKATHTFRALVVDRQGKIRGSFDMLDPAKIAEMKTLLKELLAEKEPPVADATEKS